MRHEIIHVTAEIAAGWLARPFDRQRRLSKLKVATYSRAMAEKRWHEPTIDPIAFTPDGLLLNGQHRLTALIQAGVELDMLVAYDVPAEQFDVIDTPLTRTAYQFIQIENAAGIAAAARVAMWYGVRREKPDGTTQPPGPAALQFDTHEVLAFVADHQEALREAVADAQRVYRGSGLPAGAHSGLIFLAREAGADQAGLDSWIDGMADGVGLGESDPRRLLRNRMGDVLTGRQVRRQAAVVWMLMLRAFNAHMQGRALTRLLYNPDDAVPAIDLTGRVEKARIDRNYRRRAARNGDEQPVVHRAVAASGRSG